MLLEALILGFVQGLTEFLPVSSSAHLILVSHYFSFSDSILNSNLFDSILHGGTFLSILFFFFKDIIETLKNKRLTALIAVSTIPTFGIGFLIEPYKDTLFRDVTVCAVMLVIFGIYMMISEKVNKEKRDLRELNYRAFLFLGLMQALAFIPGVSRSGVTIASAFMLGVKRDRAVLMSFLMSIPVIAAAFIYEMKKAVMLGDAVPFSAVSVGLLSSFVFGLLALGFLVKFIKRYKFANFAYYRFFIAVLIIISLWIGR